MKNAEYSDARRRLASLFFIPIVFSLLFFAVNLLSEHNDVHITNLKELQGDVGLLRGIASDSEVGEQAFLLTGDPRYLAILQGANGRLKSMDRVIRRAPAEGDLQPQIERLFALVGERVRLANEVIGIQGRSGLDAALNAFRTDDAELSMDQVRTLVTALQADINRLTSQRIEYDHRLTTWDFLLFLFGTLITLLAMIALYHSLISYIDARDQAHGQLRTLNEDLERRISERTQELQQFNEELQQFAYVASHDLQEPLRTITSFAQLLEARYKAKLDEDADEFIGYIVNSARRMTDLINGLLALVRLRKSGQPAFPVSLATILQEAQTSLQASIREHDALIEAGELPTLMVDRVQFAQVFQNLISNAMKYRSDERPHIRIRSRRDSSHWILSIADNGRGFEQQFAERIFGLFQRLHSREVEGTGMGLTISRSIIERHGGRMWAESKEKVGSTFFFSLPVSLEAHGPVADSEAMAHGV